MKMISIIGAPGSGKTSFACQLARAYGKQGKRTLVVFLDDQNPPFSYLLPSSTIKKEQVLSLGSLLSDYDITQNKIWKSACTVMDGKVALLGYLKSDTQDSYPMLTEYCVESFVAQIQKVDADIIIWDVSNINNVLYKHIADTHPLTISVIRSVPKDLSWALRFDGFNVDTVVLNAVTRGQELPMSYISSRKHRLPWSDKLNSNVNFMEPFGNVDRKYEKAILKLLSQVDV